MNILSIINQQSRLLVHLTFIIVFTSACTNSINKSLSTPYGGLLGATGTTGTTGGTGTSGASIVINNVTPGSAGNNNSPTFNIYFDTAKSSASISNYCNVITSTSSQTSKPCICQYSWNESNPNSGSSVAIPRTVQKPVTNVQIALVTCNAPDVYNTEIINGTQLKITVLPAPSNQSAGQFSVNNFLYTKSNTQVSGSFQDDQGHIFDNVVHYSCYQTYSRGMSIVSKSTTLTNSATARVSDPILFASQFCVNSAGGGSPASQGCSALPPADFSSQAFYYNMYIRKTERGGFNQTNANYICPRVVESLDSNNTTGSQGAPWPSDETFALSLGPTKDFTVGVDAHTKLSGNQDPTTGNTTCGGTTQTGNYIGASTAGVITGCLGFAAPVNSDGTCPYIKDSTQQIRPTYRLRRYIALYPRMFNTDGSLTQGQLQGADTIYVLDRPVRSPTTADPRKPYTMLGPKPCPFSFYDRKSVTGQRGYVATSNAAWSGKNVDGIELPNIDGTDATGKASCSAMIPVLAEDRSYITFSTINKNSTVSTLPAATPSGLPHLYIRPAQAFLPHYEEDTDFKACAPQAFPIKDAPLHFSRDPVSGNVAWCSESYPTQNPYIKSIDPVISASGTTGLDTPSGTISPFTSHLVKNSSSSTCRAVSTSPRSSKYLYPIGATASSGYAYHSSVTQWEISLANPSGNASQTCDRTVAVTDLDWTRFPLLAKATDIEVAINTDSSYNCTVTYDNKSGKTGLYTPTDGCCDKNSVFVCSGFGSNCTTASKQNAHLEPDVPCRTPGY